MNRTRLAEFLFLSGMVLLAASMPLSVFGMSLAQFFLLGGWLLAGKATDKLKLALSDKTTLVLVGIYLVHIAGLLYSTDLDYAFNDLRVKLPLLLLPVLLFTAPAALRKHSGLVLNTMVAAVFVSTLISTGVLYGLVPRQQPISDVREISIFISHIRLSLFVCLSIFLAAGYLFGGSRPAYRLGCAALILWFLFFLYKLESMTGFFILSMALPIAGFRLARRNRVWKSAYIILMVAAPVTLACYIKKEAATVYSHATVDFAALEKSTPGGNQYTHYPDRKEQENANLVWIYVCEPEMEAAWNLRSAIPYAGHDHMGHEIKYTLIRFLASKGWRKDSLAVAQLTSEEITSIETGIANADQQHMGNLRQRFRKTIKEYYLFVDGGNPTGSSMMQRFEYWKAGLYIFRQHWLTGVGTGDVQLAFNDAFRKSQTQLEPEKWHRAHNQFLTMGIAFGLPGFLYFLFAMGYPLMKRRNRNATAYVSFWLVAMLSMLTEDTLETQAGVTFFAFLNSFLLFFYKQDSPHNKA